MMGSRSRPDGMVWSFLLSAVACLIAGGAFAATPMITRYVVVQPIDVCSSTGTGCAPYNETSTVGNVTCTGSISGATPTVAGTTLTITSCSSGTPHVADTLSGTGIAAGTIIMTGSGGLGTFKGTVNNSQLVAAGTAISATGPIGFWVNPTTGAAYPATGGVDVTRAMLNQIGVDLAWNPIVQFNSPNNPSTGTTYQTLNVVTGAATTCGSAGSPPTGFQSCDFVTLSQQNGISTGKVPSPTNPVGVPVSPTASVINMFFVNKLNPPASQSGSQLYDFSWVNNNGISIGGNAFFPAFPLTPRIDTLAHAIFHNLGLDHTTYGAGPYNPVSATNPFPPGGILPPYPPPTTVIVGECDAGYAMGGCEANVMTTGSLRTEPTLACVLAPTSLSSCSGKPTLGNGMADQVTTEADTDTTLGPMYLPVSQQAAVVDPSGLTFAIPTSTTTVSQLTSKSFAFNVTGAATDGGPNETLLAWALVLPSSLPPSARNPISIIKQQYRRNLVSDIDYPQADAVDNAPGGTFFLGTMLYNQCTTPTVQCLIVEFNSPGAGTNNGKTDYVNFSLSFKTAATVAALCNADVTLIFSDGHSTTGMLEGGPCSGGTGSLTANSQTPDLTSPIVPQIVNPTNFATAASGQLPCSGSACIPPSQTQPADLDASQEGGQLPPGTPIP
jgi:hypothetical protein